MTLLPLIVPPFATGLALGAMIGWPLAYRAGTRAHERDQKEIARILDGVTTPTVRPAVIATTGWDTHGWVRPTAAHASLRVATTPKGYRPRHDGRPGPGYGLIRAHLAAAEVMGRPPAELVAAR